MDADAKRPRVRRYAADKREEVQIWKNLVDVVYGWPPSCFFFKL